LAVVSNNEDANQVRLAEAINNGVRKSIEQVPPFGAAPNGPALRRLQDGGQTGPEFIAKTAS
jgi:hypothetical protein